MVGGEKKEEGIGKGVSEIGIGEGDKRPMGRKDMIRFFFFQAEDGIRDAQESRGLGDRYKRQATLRAE